MTWFKVDDKLHDHRKTRRALRSAGKRRDAAAMGLWSLAGSWCADNLTDGFVPADELDRWDDDADTLAQRLVDAGFWLADEEAGEPGFRFHDWEDSQPTRADVERKREAARERMRAVRATPKKRSPRVRANTKGTAPEVLPTPSRPVPSPTAAAADDAAAAAVLPGSIDVLRAKLQAHTPLRGLRFDSLTTDTTDRLEQLVTTHGDEALVRIAVDTCRNPPPVHVGAFLGTWEALPPPGTRHLGVVRPQQCTTHGTTLNARGDCSSCAADLKAGHA